MESLKLSKRIFIWLILFMCDVSLSSVQKLDFVDVATGSLGQGLSVACGMAYTGKHWDKSR